MVLIAGRLAVAGSPGLTEIGAVLVPDEDWSDVTDPSVVYAPDTGVWHLFFGATRSDIEVGEGCDVARVIGHAESVDGLNWAVDAEPVLAPADDWAPCGASSPAALQTATGWHLFYVGHALGDAGVVGAGIGRATGAPDGFSPGARVVSDEQAADPSAIELYGEIHLAWVTGSELHLAVSEDHGASWEARGAVLGACSFEWLDVGLAGAALSCHEDMEVHPFALWIAGVSQNDDVSYGTAMSPDGLEWYVSSDASEQPDTSWTGWDFLIAGDVQLVYFSRPGEAGDEVVLASTAESWGEPSSRSCRVDEPASGAGGAGEELHDTDVPDDAGVWDSGQQEPLEDEPPAEDGDVQAVESGLADEPTGCGCAGSTGSGSWMLALLLGVLRRRH